jgi:hypothetical protein
VPGKVVYLLWINTGYRLVQAVLSLLSAASATCSACQDLQPWLRGVHRGELNERAETVADVCDALAVRLVLRRGEWPASGV